MKKEQVDVDNESFTSQSRKTVNGIGDHADDRRGTGGFPAADRETPGSDFLFPTPKKAAQKPYMTNLRKVWAGTLKRAGVPYFALYELRHTFATRLSAGGVADHMVTQMLRQGDADVFKLYSRAKLGMNARGAREAGSKGERARNFEHTAGELSNSMHILWHTRSHRTTGRREDGFILKGLVGRAAGI